MSTLHIHLSRTGLLRLATLATIYRLFTSRANRARQRASWFPGRDHNASITTRLAHVEAQQDAVALEAATNEGFS